MRLLVLLLLTLLAALQHRLWLGQHSVMEYWAHKTELAKMEQQNEVLAKRNKLLKADVTDLQIGLDAIEERARNELGLIRQDEVFFRIISPLDKKMTAIPAIATVIPAAGVGKRMQADKPKQYLSLCGLTVLEQTLHRLKQVPALQQFYLALSPDDAYFSELPLATDPQIQRLEGGAERANSVLNALLQIDAQLYPWVLVHDAARPVVRVSDIELLIQRCIATEQGGILATPVRDTMKRGSDIIEHTVDRANLWHAYTPQLFPTVLLREALQQALAQGVAITDEASAMEWAGLPVLLVQGHADNIKITQAEDLALAAFYLEHSV